MKSFAIGLIAIAVLAPALFGQTAAYTPQRTPEGTPDLEGIWQPQTNGAAYSILPHPPGFLLGAGSKVGIVEGGNQVAEDRIENSVPTPARVKDRHVQHQHRVMPTLTRAKPLSEFLLMFGMHATISFR